MAVDTNSFSATKSRDQDIVVSTAGGAPVVTKIYFETTNSDSGKHFYSDGYVADDTVTKRFVLDKVTITDLPKNWEDTDVVLQLDIFKNGSSLVSSSSIDKTTVDDYNKSIENDREFTFPALIADGVSLSSGDVITAKVTIDAATTPGGVRIKTGATFFTN